MSVSTETLEKLKVQLKAQKDLGTPINGDLYSHLFEVFNRIILHHQKDGFDKFEDISAFVKYHNFKISDPDQDIDVNGQAAAPPSAAQLVAYLDKFRDLLAEKPDMVAPEDKGLVATEITCGMPDFPSHAAILAQAGVGFGEDTSLMVQKSLRRLAKVSGAKTLKLFGKILGTSADYWVAQGTLPNADEPLKSAEQEARGKGVNATVFWVTNDLVGDWIQLPDAEPELVKAAQTFKKMFTGKLSAPVDSCPPFPGKEKHLLRAQLARIQHSTELIPKGVLEKDEESGALKLAEEQPPTDTEALKDLANWAHLPAGILKAGRCSHFFPPGTAEEALEELKAAADEKDKPFEELAAAAADLVLDRKTGKMYPAEEVPEDADRQDPWTTKIVGDTQLYKLGEGTVSYAVNVIESTRWPGAMTVAQGGQYCSLYIGDGVKSGDTVSLLPKLEEVADDPEEPLEQDEPQGKERRILTADENIDAIKAAKDGNEELKEAANVTAEQLTEWIKALGEEFNDDEVKRMMAVAVKAEGGEEEEGKLNFEETLAAMATE